MSRKQIFETIYHNNKHLLDENKLEDFKAELNEAEEGNKVSIDDTAELGKFVGILVTKYRPEK